MLERADAHRGYSNDQQRRDFWSDIAIGRMTVPGRYLAPARFEADPNPADESWSGVLEFEELDRGTARFLVDEASHHLLQSGVTFEMYAGRALAVTVTVL